MTNHIELMLHYLTELNYLALDQRWIDRARAAHHNQLIQLLLDRHQTQVTARLAQLHDEIFEIVRSN